MGFCKTCGYYEKGFDGKPGICGKLRVANLWDTYDNLKEDGIGYIDENWNKENAVMFVGENFGCIHYAVHPSIH